MDSAQLSASLAQPRAWPARPERVECIETHISRVYLVGALAYKVKKQVVLPFLDYGTLEKRRFFCEEEVRLNRRLAPEVYLRVAPIGRAADGRVALDGEGEIVEYAVEMVRLPAHGMLDAKLERGEVDNELMRSIAGLLARFHGAAATGAGVDEHASFAAVARNVRDNFAELAPHTGGAARVASPRLLAHLSEAAERVLASSRSLFERRVSAARAREGHGDLHAGNVCVTERGIVAYDCIEFSPRFRCADVACDLAFLAMDLDLRGFRGFSMLLVKSYAEQARDVEFEELVPFYKAYRALVRAKVAAIRAASAKTDSERAGSRREAMRYVHLAASYSLPPLLALTCGLPASGKSWVAAHVAAPFEAVSLSSDVRRKLLSQVRLDEHRTEALDSGLYAPAAKERTYESLLASAREALGHARSVVVDATFSSAAWRAPFRALARELGVPFVVVHATAGEEVIRRRMEERSREAAQVSDATWAVYESAKTSFEVPDELAPRERVEHRSGEEAGEDMVARVVERALEQVA